MLKYNIRTGFVLGEQESSDLEHTTMDNVSSQLGIDVPCQLRNTCQFALISD